MRTMFWLSGFTLFLASCGGKGGNGETGVDADDTAPHVETEGLLLIEGEATVIGEWSGTESIVLRADLGIGEVDCQIDYTITSTSPATTCDACMVAWNVVLGAATTTTSDFCDTVGYDAATIAALDGEARMYGIALDYIGHANVLLVQNAGEWDVEAYVDWNETAGTVNYEWDQGYHTY